MHSYRTLRQGKEMGNEKITAIATKHSKSSAQILGRWCVQQGIVYIPKSEKKERMVENAGQTSCLATKNLLEVTDGLRRPPLLRGATQSISALSMR